MAIENGPTRLIVGDPPMGGDTMGGDMLTMRSVWDYRYIQVHPQI